MIRILFLVGCLLQFRILSRILQDLTQDPIKSYRILRRISTRKSENHSIDLVLTSIVLPSMRSDYNVNHITQLDHKT